MNGRRPNTIWRVCAFLVQGILSLSACGNRRWLPGAVGWLTAESSRLSIPFPIHCVPNHSTKLQVFGTMSNSFTSQGAKRGWARRSTWPPTTSKTTTWLGTIGLGSNTPALLLAVGPDPADWAARRLGPPSGKPDVLMADGIRSSWKYRETAIAESRSRVIALPDRRPRTVAGTLIQDGTGTLAQMTTLPLLVLKREG